MATVQQLFDLTGRVAVVTGAGSGLGVTFAEALAEAGASIVCAGLDINALERTAGRIRERGHGAIAVVADVTDEGAVRTMIERTVEEFGRIDILVNNAGIATSEAPETLSLSDWQRVVDVNLTGVFLCAQATARVMIEAGHGGSIINIASILGAGASEPAPSTAYAASKGAVVNLTRDLAVHWAPYGIRVNAIGPAYFPSEMTAGMLKMPEIVSEIERRTPLGRLGRLDELKGPVVFLASDAASYVTGENLFVDGGWTAW
ncbi:MAG TPA: glucose 1-dehydrogenase [Thermomicrobiales bacterium]|nr:glucose 1-dehydrogenase [Thermomicrobiales bacterium]